ncbi:glycosyl hydrolase [Microdochium nivale]|nr:glycosyl hydrolase [Microdochium nivale]
MRNTQNNRRPRSGRGRLSSAALALLSASAIPALAQGGTSNSTSPSPSSPSSSKRGLSIHGNTATQDYNLFLQSNSPVAWYYTWSPWPNQYIEKAAATNNKKIEFLPLLHGVSNLDSDIARLSRADITPGRLLTFNEPDGELSTGGSGITPQDAARAYVDKIMPLRKGSKEGGKWLISHPVVTGSPRGLDWLRDFCEACEDINGDNGGCPTDFVAAHWYGEFLGLQGWLGQLREFYADPKHSFRPDLAPSGGGGSRRGRNAGRQDSGGKELEIIVTEMGLPQQDAQATQSMLNQTIPFLDGSSWVSGYSWFGLFREGSADATGWAGEAVAMLDGNGGLTEIGAMFLGGQQAGYAPGESIGGDQSGDGSGDAEGAAARTGGVSAAQGWLVAACVGFSLSLTFV